MTQILSFHRSDDPLDRKRLEPARHGNYYGSRLRAVIAAPEPPVRSHSAAANAFWVVMFLVACAAVSFGFLVAVTGW